MSREKGWEFLFGGDKESGSFRSDDGDEGYIYADGSGYFRGADGSDGYIHSDGSGYFHGADGSDGYKYADGSGYYHGANGVDANQYSDGSGYYETADGDREHYDSITELSKTESSGGSGLADLAATALFTLAGIGAAKFGDLVAEEMRAEREKERLREERRAEFWKRHWKTVFISIGCLILGVLFAVGIWELGKLIPMGYDSSTLIGQNYEDVFYSLQTAGFTNIKLEGTEDLSIEEKEKENSVYQIYVMGKNKFSSTTRYPYDTKITIKYHAVKKIAVPLSHREAKGMQYTEVVGMFEAAGFVNVRNEIIYDLITGWITENGSVKSVIVDGDTKFDTDDTYRPDAEIVITYHTFKKNKPADK